MIAFSNLAAPGWTIERTVDAVEEFGFDGLELRLLDGEPVDVWNSRSKLAAPSRRQSPTSGSLASTRRSSSQVRSSAGYLSRLSWRGSGGRAPARLRR